MTSAAYDFRAPPPADVERRVTAWAEEACRRSRTVWASAVPFPVTLTVRPATLVTARVAATAGPPGGFVGLCQTSPPAATLTFGFPAPFVHGVIGGLLGGTPTDPPEVDRPLSSLERPLFEYLARDLFAATWADAWTDGPGPTLAVTDLGPARTLWRPPGEMAVLVVVSVTTPFGEYECPVMLPRSEWAPWFQQAPKTGPPASAGTTERGRIESLVRKMDVSLTVDLGTAEVTLVELSKLRVGDLIVLNQKITDPLSAQVGGESKLKVWPGLVGTRHAIQVHAVAAVEAPPPG